MPLKSEKAVLEETKNAILSIKNTILFEENHFFKTNQLDWDDHYLNYCVHSNPLSECPNFVIEYIVNQTENADGDYAKLAKHGATILITIYWDCIVDGWFSKLIIESSSWLNDSSINYNCKPNYGFKRIDKNANSLQTDNNIYKSVVYSDWGTRRTLIKSHRIVFKVETKATLYQVDCFNFIRNISAFSGLFFLISIPFRMIINYIWLKGIQIVDVIIL